MHLLDAAVFKIFRLPTVTINLMLEKTQGNHPFYATIVRKFYDIANARHAKLFFAKQYEYGFALCRLPETFDEYFQGLKKSARWNFRKASRLGYEVKRFNVNSKLDDIAEIWRSAPIRQGKMPKVIREGRVSAVNDPPSQSRYHDYFYIGVFRHGKLLAYASCAILGELCNLNDLYGHIEYEHDAIVPLLLIKIVEDLYEKYPSVKFYAYGTYFGARAPMRRFKRKFGFHPYHVTWLLESPTIPQTKTCIIYRRTLAREQSNLPHPDGYFVMAAGWSDLSKVFPLWRTQNSWLESLRCAMRVLSGKRIFYGFASGEKIIHSGWAHIGFCRHYSVETDAIVLGRLWTAPEFRRKGFASSALRRIMNVLHRKGFRHFYIDTKPYNIAAQKVIANAGFSQIVG